MMISNEDRYYEDKSEAFDPNLTGADFPEDTLGESINPSYIYWKIDSPGGNGFDYVPDNPEAMKDYFIERGIEPALAIVELHDELLDVFEAYPVKFDDYGTERWRDTSGQWHTIL
ncbi:hypothetical protein [Levilactobacillus bambusae]|uniref:Uncharacterized protein n=1 Tax=Levilactobacillus bambusae TaxID=2024736 RepID=A0A2V1N3A8_9LACO|nr:hypothetical protein [Levilactobacillus bambusae]PWG00978.1 hypothetical protein DCM90_02040 [Levilactobacillus bambusae]